MPAVSPSTQGVNLSTGHVALSLPLVTVPGPDGLDIALVAMYSSAIHTQVSTWNEDAPTGTLGLGWSLARSSIIRATNGVYKGPKDTFYLIDGDVYELVPRGQDGPDYLFGTDPWQLWTVRYSPATEEWTVVKENGVTYTFGGSGGTAVAWGIRWGNWIGSSNNIGATSGQDLYASAWHLADVESVYGKHMTFTYDAVRAMVAPNSLTYTQAIYLASVSTEPGNDVSLVYRDKDAQEYPTPQSSRLGINPYQQPIETRYLSSLTVSTDQQVNLYTVELGYDFLNTGNLRKRLLSSITKCNPAGRQYEPPYVFTYYDESQDVHVTPSDRSDIFNADTHALYGALALVSKPSGETVEYRYDAVTLENTERRTVVDPPARPGTWGSPRIYYGADYAVVTWYDGSNVALGVYTWVGSWQVQDLGSFPVSALQMTVTTGRDFVALLTPGQTSSLALIHRDQRCTGRWVLQTEAVQIASQCTAMAGDDVYAVLETGTGKLYQYAWNGSGWESPSPNPTVLDTQPKTVFAAAAAGRSVLAVFARPDNSCPPTAQQWTYDEGCGWRSVRTTVPLTLPPQGTTQPSGSTSINLQVVSGIDRLTVVATPTCVAIQGRCTTTSTYEEPVGPAKPEQHYQITTTLTLVDFQHFVYGWDGGGKTGSWAPLQPVHLTFNQNAPQTDVILTAVENVIGIAAPTAKYLHHVIGAPGGSGGTVEQRIANPRLNDDQRSLLYGLDATVGIRQSLLGTEHFYLYQYDANTGTWTQQPDVVLPDRFDSQYFLAVVLPTITTVIDTFLMYIPLENLIGAVGDVIVNALYTIGTTAVTYALGRAPKPGDLEVRGLRYIAVGTKGSSEKTIFTRLPGGSWARADSPLLVGGAALAYDVFTFSNDFVIFSGVEGEGTHSHLYVLRNGTVAGRLVIEPAGQYSTKGSQQQPALAGPGMLAAYPRSAGSFENARSFCLYRIIGDGWSGPVETYVVSQVCVADGYQTINTFIDYDPLSAALDPALLVGRFGHVSTSCGGVTALDAWEASGGDEFFMYTGAMAPAVLPPPSEFTPHGNAISYPAAVTGLPYHRRSCTNTLDAAPKWQVAVPAAQAQVKNSVVAGPDGTAYIGTAGGWVNAFNPVDGSVRWSVQVEDATGYDANVVCVVGPDGTIYATTNKGNIYALTEDGTLQWTFTTPDLTSPFPPVVGPDGRLYVTDEGSVHAVDALTGMLVWTSTFAYGGQTLFATAPGVVAPDQYIYVGLGNSSEPWPQGAVYAIPLDSPRDGGQLFVTEGDITSALSIGEDGTIYAVTTTGNLYAVSPQGQNLSVWPNPLKILSIDGQSAPVVGNDGTIYVKCGPSITAVTPQGRVTWTSAPAPANLNHSLTVGPDGCIYATYDDGHQSGLWGVTPEGASLWASEFSVNDLGIGTGRTQIGGRPAVAADGTIYVNDFAAQHVYAVFGRLSTAVQTESTHWNIWEMPLRDDRVAYLPTPIESDEVTDGVASVVTYAYDVPSPSSRSGAYSGRLSGEATTFVDESGTQESIVTSYTYGSEVYSALQDIHLLSPVVQMRTVRQAGSPAATLATQTTVSTWDTGGSGTPTPSARYRWLGTNASTFSSWTSAEPGQDWLKEAEVVQMAAGTVLEQKDVDGLATSRLYDRQFLFPIAEFQGASLAEGEAYYCGFEPYEDTSGWRVVPAGKSPVTPQDGSAIDSLLTSGIAATGSGCLHLPPGTTVALTLPPGGYSPPNAAPSSAWTEGARFILSVTAKTAAGFSGDDGTASLQVLLPGASLNVPITDTQGDWKVCTGMIQPQSSGGRGSAFPTLAVSNAKRSADLWIDDIRLFPLGSLASMQVYDPQYRMVLAAIDANGGVTRTIYDDLQSPLGTIGPDGQVVSLAVQFSSRDTQTLSPEPVLGMATDGVVSADSAPVALYPDALVADEPNSLFFVVPRAGGIYCDLSTGAACGWTGGTIQNGSLVLQPGGTATFAHGGGNYGIRLLLSPSSSDISSIPAVIELSLGAARVSFGMAPSLGFTLWTTTTSVGTVNVNRLGTDWLLLVVDALVLFYVDGQCLFANQLDVTITGDITLAVQDQSGKGMAFRNIFVFDDPTLSAHYLDGSDRPRQTQVLESGTSMVTQETLYDARGRMAMATVPVRKGAGAARQYGPGFEPEFVSGRDPQGNDPLWSADTGNANRGVMSGLIQSWLDPQFATQYPYTATVYEPNPLSRVAATTAPSAAYSVAGTHVTRTIYGPSPEAATLLQMAGLSARASAYSVATRYLPLDDTRRLASVYIRDAEGNPVLSGAVSPDTTKLTSSRRVYTTAPPSAPLAALVSPMWTATIRLPNSYAPPPGQTGDAFQSSAQYNQLGLLIGQTSPDGGSIQYIYDRAGRLSFAMDADGSAASPNLILYWRYDRLGRLTEAGYLLQAWNALALQAAAYGESDWPSGCVPLQKLTYDVDAAGGTTNLIGHIATITTSTLLNAPTSPQASAPVVETFSYDAYGSIVRHSLVASDFSAENQVTRYTYDGARNLSSIVYPVVLPHGGFAPTTYYSYNRLGSVSAIGRSPGDSSYAAYAYHADGSVAVETLGPSSIIRTYTYNSMGWLIGITDPSYLSESLSYQDSGGQYLSGNIATAQFTFSPQASWGSPGATSYIENYAYDTLGQLVQAQNSAIPDSTLTVGTVQDGRITASYDADGNIRQYSWGTGAPVQVPFQPGTNRIVTLQSESYNPSGTLSSVSLPSDPSLIAAFSYDPLLRQPASVAVGERGAGTGTDYRYGSALARVLKTRSENGQWSSKTLYVHAGRSMPLVEKQQQASEPSFTDQTWYIYGPTGLVAIDDGEYPLSVLKDHLRSTRVLVHDAPSVVAYYSYTPWGNLIDKLSSATNAGANYRFTGQEYDAETGLYHFPARLYDSRTGRFYAPDPAGQYASPYVYAGNNPINLLDPSGQFGLPSGAIISGIFSGLAVGSLIGGAIYGGVTGNWVVGGLVMGLGPIAFSAAGHGLMRGRLQLAKRFRTPGGNPGHPLLIHAHNDPNAGRMAERIASYRGIDFGNVVEMGTDVANVQHDNRIILAMHGSEDGIHSIVSGTEGSGLVRTGEQIADYLHGMHALRGPAPEWLIENLACWGGRSEHGTSAAIGRSLSAKMQGRTIRVSGSMHTTTVMGFLPLLPFMGATAVSTPIVNDRVRQLLSFFGINAYGQYNYFGFRAYYDLANDLAIESVPRTPGFLTRMFTSSM